MADFFIAPEQSVRSFKFPCGSNLQLTDGISFKGKLFVLAYQFEHQYRREALVLAEELMKTDTPIVVTISDRFHKVWLGVSPGDTCWPQVEAAARQNRVIGWQQETGFTAGLKPVVRVTF